MNPPIFLAVPTLILSFVFAGSTAAAPSPSNAAGEYAKHFAALSGLSVAVAQAMPADQYGFRPHPESMDFGQLMSHIATTNYQFCAGLKDTQPPALPSPSDKDGVVKFLSDSFAYCTDIISNLTDAQLSAAHDSPDGHLPGREVLLAMYVHVAHHRPSRNLPPRQRHPPTFLQNLKTLPSSSERTQSNCGFFGSS